MRRKKKKRAECTKQLEYSAGHFGHFDLRGKFHICPDIHPATFTELEAALRREADRLARITS
jgi:hypothetical protein